MRNNVECKRCPCGAILSLRESCKRCADAARARLHAEGVAAVEVWWLDSSPKPYQQDALRRVEQAKHEPPPAPHGFQLHGLRGARFGAVGSLDEWAAGGLDAWTRSQSYEPPPVDRTFQVTYPGTWEDGAPVYTNACGMPSRTPDPPPVGAEVAWGRGEGGHAGAK